MRKTEKQKINKALKIIAAIAVAAMIGLFCGCDNVAMPDTSICTVVIEDCRDVTAKPSARTVLKGSDVVFTLQARNGCKITGTDYADYELRERGETVELVLRNVRYSRVVTLETSYKIVEYHKNDGSGAVVTEPIISGHLLTNTAAATLFTRDGYVFSCWNTAADGTGERVGAGSRTYKKDDMRLYAIWEKAAPAADFAYYKDNGAVYITDYLGDAAALAVPATLDGAPVRYLCENAFANSNAAEVVLPPSLYEIEPRAFAGSALRELTICDNISLISDESFADCDGLRTLRINAVEQPVYSGNYFDTFPDKLDRLKTIADEKKIVLFSGSSARFGYDSGAIERAFPAYKVVNMGVFAYTNALPQLEVIRRYTKPGDILLAAPEFDAVDAQLCVSDTPGYEFFAMTEANYDAVALLDLRLFTGVFDAFARYKSIKSSMPPRDYALSAADYNENGEPAPDKTYNEYGDYIYPRAGGDKEEMLKFVRADYTAASFPLAKIAAYNKALKRFTDDGVTVLFSYAPRNVSSLTKESTPSARRELHAHLCRNLDVPVISDVEDYLYSAVYFYEIDNHLSDEGVAIRTKKVIEDMRKAGVS